MNMLQENRLQKLNAAIEQVKEIFQANTEAYLWVINYSITHSVLTFIIHRGNYLNGHKIVCGGCDYLSGPLQGGPYELKLDYEPQTPDGLSKITILGNDHEFVLKCSRISASISQEIEEFQKKDQIPADVAARLVRLNRQVEQSAAHH